MFYNGWEGGKMDFKERLKIEKKVQFWGGRTWKFRLFQEELMKINGQIERYFIRGCTRVKIFEIGRIISACRQRKMQIEELIFTAR